MNFRTHFGSAYFLWLENIHVCFPVHLTILSDQVRHNRICTNTFLILSQSMILSPFMTICFCPIARVVCQFLFFDLVKQLEFVSMTFSWIALRRRPFKPNIIYSGHDGAMEWDVSGNKLR